MHIKKKKAGFCVNVLLSGSRTVKALVALP